jgi:hypothetical protein
MHPLRQRLKLIDLCLINLPRIEGTGSNGERSVNAVASAVGSYGVALSTVFHSGNDRTTDEGIGVAPVDRHRVRSEVAIVGGEVDVVELDVLWLLDIGS